MDSLGIHVFEIHPGFAVALSISNTFGRFTKGNGYRFTPSLPVNDFHVNAVPGTITSNFANHGIGIGDGFAIYLGDYVTAHYDDVVTDLSSFVSAH